jgi:hypothetical protein
MNRLSLFSIYHLNLMFSSIGEEQRPEVVRRCYWPLLRLIRRYDLPLGIEASGYTLEAIHAIDPSWIAELRDLCENGPAEFIGSGYAQIIGPLVPADVNRDNQRLGLETYEKTLGFRPQLVLVNEQAYAAGLIPIYLQAGYRAIVMEWDNPGSNHPEWDPDWRYLPQYALGPDDTALPVIWNKSIPFQKFQRYTHGEIELPEYLDFLSSHRNGDPRTFALYGNDAEIFDFRPGRFHTEAGLGETSEWLRIAHLYEALLFDDRFSLIGPHKVLDFLERPGAGNRLRLETAAHPVPVKKQAKYNVVRWGLTGRDDMALNTACWRLYQTIADNPACTDADRRELCYLWSSDFRTHITAGRWQKMQSRLTALQQRLVPPAPSQVSASCGKQPQTFTTGQEGSFFIIETATQKLRLNLRRGMAIDGWWNKQLGSAPLIGTLPHGYFDDIQFGMDYYTGHFVLEVAGQHKITDLVAVEPRIAYGGGNMSLSVEIQTPIGPVTKTIRVDAGEPRLEISHHFHWPSCPLGTLRLGHVTLNPEAFDGASLFFRSHNGGYMPETFWLHGEPINHLTPVSTLVSANNALGMTSGLAELGDRLKWVRIQTDKTSAALTGHIVHAPVNHRYLYRLALSAMEMDDTACRVQERHCFHDRRICLTITSGT